MVVLPRPISLRSSPWARAMGMKRTFLNGLVQRPGGTMAPISKPLLPTASQKSKGYGIDMHHQGADVATGGGSLIAMEERARDTACSPYPGGRSKDRATARPDRCNGPEVGCSWRALSFLGLRPMVRLWAGR